MAGEIFISYQRSDDAWARFLHTRLKAEGIDAWYDIQIGAGQDWRASTVRALESSRIVVLLMTKAALQSQEVAKELEAATLSRKLIVPVRIEDIQPTGAFLYELAGRNWVDAFERTESRLGELAKNLAQLVRSGAADSPVPPAGRGSGELQSATAARRIAPRWRAAAVVTLAALVAAGLAFALLGERGQSAPTAQKTAFFGFDAPGDDPAAKAIADSASSEVFSTLGAMRLATAARAETFGVPPGGRFERARELGASYALSGEVLREAAQVTMSIRLEDVRTRSTLWTENVSGGADETIVLPVRAATLATDTLQCVAVFRAGLPKDDIEPVRLMPRVCRDARAPSLAMLPVLRDLLRAAPAAAQAQANFAIGALIVLPSVPETARPALLVEAETAAERAMMLDARLPDAWLARYWVAVRRAAPLTEQTAVLADGLRVAPESANLNNYYAGVLQSAGRNRDALPYTRLAVANDPLSGPKQTGFASLLAISGLAGEAEAAFERLMTRTPDASRWQVRIRNAVLHNVGDAGRLLAAPPAMVPRAVIDCWREIYAAHRSADNRQRRSGVDAASACRARGNLDGVAAMAVLASLGDIDGAFALMDGSTPRFATGHLFWPSTRAMRADPRFLPLVEKLSLMAFWKSTGTRPDVCDTEKAPFCIALTSGATEP